MPPRVNVWRSKADKVSAMNAFPDTVEQREGVRIFTRDGEPVFVSVETKPGEWQNFYGRSND